MKQLFRRVAAALPGMEVKQETETMVEVNLQVNNFEITLVIPLPVIFLNLSKLLHVI